jgi:hypothetical protein
MHNYNPTSENPKTTKNPGLHGEPVKPSGDKSSKNDSPSSFFKSFFPSQENNNKNFTGIVSGTNGGKSRKLRKSRKLSNKKR